MAIDIWNGNGNWSANPTDWSLDAPPSLTEDAEIQAGDDALTGAGSVDFLGIIANAELSLSTSAAALTVAGNLNNAGTFSLDTDGGDGGGDATIAGRLINSGSVNLGNSSLAKSTTVTAASLLNSGSLTLWGNNASATTDQTTLHITGAAPATLTGDVSLHGDALLEFGSGGVTSIAAGAQLELDGAQARVGIGAVTTNTGLSGLASNSGMLDIEGNSSAGPGGATLTTTVALTNSGTLDVDTNGGDSGSKVTVGGTLTNAGTIDIGSGSSLTIDGILTNGNMGSIVIGEFGLVASTTVTATGVVNVGSITLSGNASLETTEQATLHLTGAVSGAVTGDMLVRGDALLEVASGGFTSIGYGADLELDGSEARVAVAAGTTNTALKGLASNSGTFNVNGDSIYGAGGVALATTVAFGNYGALNIDANAGNGGSVFTIGGALANAGSMTIGNVGLGGATTVTATTLTNSGSLTMWGGADDQLSSNALTTLDITGAAPAVLTGDVILHGDTLLEFKSGGITSIGYGASLELDGSQARVSIGSSTTNSALKDLANNFGTFDIESEAGFGFGPGAENVTTAVGFTNQGLLDVDYIGGDNDSSFTIGGTLTNAGTIVVGNSSLNFGNPTANVTATVTATTLDNEGSITVSGGNTLGTTAQATLDITGAGPGASSGNITLNGDAMLEFGSVGITSIGFGAELELNGSQARVSLGGGTTSTGLSNLASNAGTLDIEGESNAGPGGGSVTTTVGLVNNGALDVDIVGGDGGSSLTIGGTLTNTGTVVIGNSSLSSGSPYVSGLTTVTASALANNGSIIVSGSDALGTIEQATLDITGAAPGKLTGDISLHGDALLEVGSGGFTSIGDGAELALNGRQARAAVGAGTTNTALRLLASNFGTLDIEGNSGVGPGGVVVATLVALANHGALDVDFDGGASGSSVTIGGILTNADTFNVGNTNLSALTLVTASGLVNDGSLTLQGNSANLTGLQATLNVLAAAPATTTGYMRVGGDALLEFNSGGIATIGPGSWFELDGAEARASIGASKLNSALTGLSSNLGTLVLRGNSSEGYGGVVIATTTGFTNSALMDVDSFGSGDGGSSLNIDGTLANMGTLDIGNTDLSYCPGAPTIITATGLVNDGSITLQGNADTLTGFQATLNITAAAPTTTTGYMRIGGDGELEFLSGGITTIGAGSWFELDGSEAQATINGGAVDSALSALSSNLGTFVLRGDSSFGSGGVGLATTTSLTNDGVFDVDSFGGDGGSVLEIGGTLANIGTFDVGNSDLSFTTHVTATTLTNSGLLALMGQPGLLGQMTISGAASNSGTVNLDAGGALTIAGATTNTGTVNIAANSTLAVTGAGHAYTQSGGTTTVAGTLAAVVDDDGGVVNFTGPVTVGTGALNVGDGGVLEFGAGVASSHEVTFTDNTATLELGAPGSFAGSIKGFADGDVIDLLNSIATSLSYSDQTLTVQGASGTIAELLFVGSYTQASFTMVSDGHGGTDILDPPKAHPLAGTSHAFG